MKGSYFGFGIPNNRLICMQGQKTLSFSYNIHLFLPYLLNDSQTIHSTIHFSKLLLCVTIGRFHLKQCLQCCFVYSVTGETAIFNTPKGHLVAKNELAFSFRATQVCARNKWVGNMLMFHVGINMKRLGIRFKTDSFQ